MTETKEMIDTGPSYIKPVTDSERKWSVLLHLSLYTFFFLIILGFIVPFVIWFFKKEKSGFFEEHATSVFNFAITMLIATVVMGIIGVGTVWYGFVMILKIGFISERSLSIVLNQFPLLLLPIFLLVLIAALIAILPIFGVRAAAERRRFHYPLSFTFFK